MARLRIRIELSRTGRRTDHGVPLEMLTSLVAETQKFLQLLAQDIRMEGLQDATQGQWVGFDFDRDNLHFTAEYLGPVTPAQLQSFNAAFDGATSLRRATIAQFAKIASGIGEDDAVGFGLFTSTEAAEPSEWRCLAHRDALRITQGIDAILGAGGEAEASSAIAQRSRLPAALDRSRQFGDRRDRGVHPANLAEYVREVESTVTHRLARVEQRMDRHDGQLQELRERSDATEESFRNLLSSIEAFCGQAASQIERARAVSALPEPAPKLVEPPLPEPTEAPATAPSLIASYPPREHRLRRWWPVIPVVAVAASGVLYLSGPWFDSGPAQPSIASAAPRQPAPEPASTPQAPPAAESTPPAKETPTPRPAQPPPAPPASLPQAQASSPPPVTPRGAASMEIEATEPAWVTVIDAVGNIVLNRLFVAGDRRVVDPGDGALLRTGNAAGIQVRLNGQPLGEIGKEGEVRTIRFENGSFKVSAPER